MRYENIDNIPIVVSKHEMIVNNEGADILGRQNIVNANKEGLKMRQQNQRNTKLGMRGYADGTTLPQGVQPQGLAGRVPQLGTQPNVGGIQRQGNSYSYNPGYVPPTAPPKPSLDLPMIGYNTPAYANGTIDKDGVQPLSPPGLMDTIRGIIAAGSDEPERKAEARQEASAPSFDEAKENYRLQQGLAGRVPGYANGVMNPNGVQDEYGMGGKYYNADRELQVKQAMAKTPFVRVDSNTPQNQPGLLSRAGSYVADNIGRSAQQVGDYFNKPAQADSLPANNAVSGIPALPVKIAQTTPPKPVVQPGGGDVTGDAPALVGELLPKTDVSPSGVDVTNLPPPKSIFSNVSDAGIPYSATGNTTNFTNPDGTGKGSISENMVVNGGLQRMLGNKQGSFSVMKLESPYGEGGKPQGVQAPPQFNYTPPAAPDYSGQIQGYLNTLGAEPESRGFDNMLADKHRRQYADSALKALTGLQEHSQNNATNQAQLGLSAYAKNQDMALARQDLENKRQAGIGENATNAAKFNLEIQKYLLDKEKGSSSINKGALEENILRLQAAGVPQDKYQHLIDLHKSLYRTPDPLAGLAQYGQPQAAQ